MSNGTFPGLLGAVVLDSTNNTVRVTENAVSENLTIPAGTYFVRGDNSSDDLVGAFATMLESHSGTNTYTYTTQIFQVLETGTPNIAITFSLATGTHQFSALFGNAATTFDASLLGFAQTDLASGGGLTIATTLSSSAIWLGNDIYRSLEPVSSWARKRSRALSGKVRAVNRRSEVRDYLWTQENIHEKRLNEEAVTTDPHRALNRFLQRHAGGLRFEFHDVILVDASLGQSEYTAGFTRFGTFVFDDDFYPVGGQFGNRADGVPLYDFSGHLLPYVA